MSPFNYDDVIQGLEEAGFTPSVLIDDVQLLIDEEAINHDVLKFQPKSAPFNYSAYHDLDEVCAGVLLGILVSEDDILLFFDASNHRHRTGKYIRRFAGIYAYYRYFIDRNR